MIRLAFDDPFVPASDRGAAIYEELCIVFEVGVRVTEITEEDLREAVGRILRLFEEPE